LHVFSVYLFIYFSFGACKRYFVALVLLSLRFALYFMTNSVNDWLFFDVDLAVDLQQSGDEILTTPQMRRYTTL